MKTEYPDYNHSIVNLACSVLKYFNVPDIRHNSLPEADSILEKRNPRNVVIMVFDAMGISILERYLPADSFTRKHIIRPITSVFPPTTVAATTAINTGLTPLETGWIGWITYFKEVDKNVITYFNSIQNTRIPAAPEHLAYAALPYRSLGVQIRETDPEVRCIAVSPFKVNRTDPTVHTKSIRENCDSIIENTKENRNFIYCYWPDPDEQMHKTGIDDKVNVEPILKEIDAELERLSKSVGDDTVVFVTADHSQINSKWIFLSDYPDLKDLLVRNHSIEFRTATFWVKDGKKDEFREKFNKLFNEHFILMTHEEFLTSGLLGTGVPHPRLDGFVGDFVAVSTDEYCIDDERQDTTLIGIHAGLTKEEMDVPLIVL